MIIKCTCGENKDICIDCIDEYEDLFCELRGLLKKNAQFPEAWDTDEALMNWLRERGEL